MSPTCCWRAPPAAPAKSPSAPRIGAGRGRIVRQLLTESVLLSLMGGSSAWRSACVGVRALLALNPGNIPRIGPDGPAVTLDWTVLAFTLVLSVLTGILFGLFPALHASRADLNSTLKEAGARSGSSLRQNKARGLLVVAEMALAIVLLVGAGLLIRTFSALHNVAPGFDPHNVLTMDTSLTGAHFDRTAAITTWLATVLERIQAMPGVESRRGQFLFAAGGRAGAGVLIEGRPLTRGPDTAARLGLRHLALLRCFQDPDRARPRLHRARRRGRPAVVLINEAMARRFWKNENPIGQRLIIGAGMGPDFAQPAREIIGIVGDARDGGLNSDPGAGDVCPSPASSRRRTWR